MKLQGKPSCEKAIGMALGSLKKILREENRFAGLYRKHHNKPPGDYLADRIKQTEATISLLRDILKLGRGETTD